MNDSVKYNSILFWFISIFTCGVGYIIWFVLLFNNVRKLDNRLLHPVLALFLGFITCGMFIPFYIYRSLTLLEENGYKTLNSYKIFSIFLALLFLNLINLYQIQELINDGPSE